MKEVLYAVLMYPFVLALDILSFFCRWIDNIKYSLNKSELKYEDIFEVKFCYDYIMDFDSTIFYEEGNNKPVDEYAEIIALEKDKFKELKSLLRTNRILEYKKNIFTFSITPLWHLWCTDVGECMESLIFKFKDGQIRRIDSYCTSKRFDTVAKYLTEVVEDVEAKNRCNKQEVQKENIKKDGFQWIY